MDETERANVWKQKSFEEMKKKERMFEKMKLGQGEIGNEVPYIVTINLCE
jgi:hypothetical protein